MPDQQEIIDNTRSDLEALINLNIRETFKAAPKTFAEKLSKDIRERLC